MYEAKVMVELKKGISDPEGANTLKALNLLGFENVKSVATNHTFIIHLDGKDKDKAEKEIEQMCRRLLTNPVIHTYKISIKEIK